MVELPSFPIFEVSLPVREQLDPLFRWGYEVLLAPEHLRLCVVLVPPYFWSMNVEQTKSSFVVMTLGIRNISPQCIKECLQVDSAHFPANKPALC
jgi:hypothetical protein